MVETHGVSKSEKTLELCYSLTHGVCAQYLQRPALCDGLEGGPCQHAVDTVPEVGGATLLLGSLSCQVGDVLVVRV